MFHVSQKDTMWTVLQSALTDFSLFLTVCVQELNAAPSVRVGGTTSRVRSVRLASVPASRRSGSVTATTTVGTTAMRMDAVSPRLSFNPENCNTSIFFSRTNLCTNLHPVSHIVLIFRHQVKSPHTVIYALGVVVMLAPLLSWCHSAKLLFTWGYLLIKNRNKMTTYHHQSFLENLAAGSAVIQNSS